MGFGEIMIRTMKKKKRVGSVFLSTSYFLLTTSIID
jgi:hypothetical protein